MDNIAKRILETIEKNKSAYLDFLSRYIQIDSTNPALGESPAPLACHEWLRDELKAFGVFDDVDFWETGDGFSNVVATVKGEGEPLMFASHTDTVPVTQVQKDTWEEGAGPWSGAIKDGRVYGRGASDMKAGGASVLMAMRVLKELGIRPKRPVYFTYVMSEENGGREKGVDSIVSRGYNAKECIVLEPTNNLRIVPAIQGEFYFAITVKGLSYHLAARHHVIYPQGYTVDDIPGANAIDMAVEIIEELHKLERELGRYTVHPLTENGSTTINFSGIESQGIFSAGAEECKIIGSMLYAPSITQEEAMGCFREAVDRAAQRNFWMRKHPPIVEIPYLLSAKPPVNVDLSHPLCRALGEAAQAFGKEARYEASLGTSDANYLQDYGIDSVTMGPGAEEYGVHGVSEFVPVDIYLDGIARLAYFLSRQ